MDQAFKKQLPELDVFWVVEFVMLKSSVLLSQL